MKKYLGIDIGGTNTKLGIVSEDGNLLEKVKYSTHQLRENKDYPTAFTVVLRDFLKDRQDIEPYIGIGVPGTITKDRRSTIDLPNIPSLGHTNLVDILEESFPDKKFLLENDANAAALGELLFSGADLPDSFIFLTLGTGIGGAVIMNREIFKGGNGNAMEVGHMFAGSKRTVEELIGKQGIVEETKKLLRKKKRSSPELNDIGELTAKDVVKAALNGDKLAVKVFSKFGKVLGRCIVSNVRVLDIHHIIIGGGVADTFELIKPSMFEVIHENLPPYYTDDLKVELATLANEAGIIGAAALGFAREIELQIV